MLALGLGLGLDKLATVSGGGVVHGPSLLLRTGGYLLLRTGGRLLLR